MLMIILIILFVLCLVGIVIVYVSKDVVHSPPPPKEDDRTEKLVVFNVSEKTEPKEIYNRNVADADGQIYYSTDLLPNRKPNWKEREMRAYEIHYIPLTEKECPENPINGDCPPFGTYAKCNPGGCADGTTCTSDKTCGKTGTCVDGRCVCCTPNKICSLNEDCGRGTCENGSCNCDNVDFSYDCNVRMYPSGTPLMGDLESIGAVVAPNKKKIGWWYSLPKAGYCEKGQTLGKDCNWKIAQDSKNPPTMEELVEHGYKVLCKKYSNDNPTRCINEKQLSKSDWENNRKILNDLLEKKPLSAFNPN